ncbi:MAG: C-terminal binding protein [Agathobacter sp.]
MTKIVITDYPRVLNRDLEYEKNRIATVQKNAEIVIVPFEDHDTWLTQVQDATALLTAFLPIDKDIMDAIPNLKCIALNASGYDNVDVKEATKRGIAVIPIEEYCTEEVAEHTIALLLALSRGLKHYEHDIDDLHIWQYSSLSGLHRICGQKLGIAGFGKIGKCVGKTAHALGMEILVYSPTGKTVNTEPYPVTFVSKEVLFAESDVITNHMAVDAHTAPFFDEAAFRSMKKQPLFLNVGRGAAVDEAALIQALDMGWIKGAGLDVLSSEKPELNLNPLVGRENVIMTPHSAFYSEESLRLLQDISCDNVSYFLNGEYEKVHRIINDCH